MDGGTKKYNVGWALLKLLMCYEVVMVHAWNAWNYPDHVVPAGIGSSASSAPSPCPCSCC